MRLRPYQQDAIGAIRQALNTNRSTLVVMATGTGKTVVFATLAHEWKEGRVLIIAHREELIAQAADKVNAITGDYPSIEMGELRSDEQSAFRSPVVVSSVQTMMRPSRLARFDPDAFGLVIVDEAHHAPAPSYRRVLDHFGQNHRLRVLGVTATPRRADERAMGEVFESVAFNYGIEEAKNDGYLVPVQSKTVVVDALDFSHIKSVAGDFHQGELEAICTEEGPLHEMIAPAVDLAGDMPTLFFCVGVKHAMLVAEIINKRYKPGAAAWVSGETDREERRDVIASYKAGRVQFLANCGIFLEGFDAPATGLVVMGRPTKSLALYTQVLGRVTRTLPGIVDALSTREERKAAIAASGKPYGVVLDFVGNHARHAQAAKQVTAADALGGKYGEQVRQYARQLSLEEPAKADVDEMLDRAEAELALLAEEAERRRRITARATYRVQDFDRGEAGPIREDRAQADMTGPATSGQVWFIVHKLQVMSHGKASKLTRFEASRLIGRERWRLKEGVA